MSAAGRRHRRPPQRRQVHARQPLRRAPRRDRRGEARRHPRPQGARRRLERPPFTVVDTGGWLAPDVGRGRRAARAPGEPSGRARDHRRRRDPLRRRRQRRASPRRTPRSRAILHEPSKPGAASSPTRSTTTAARPSRGRSPRLGLGDASAGLRDPRAGERRPARRARRRAAARAEEPEVDADDGDLLASRSSAAPTSASRRCSTGSSATSARSCTTCPAPPATRSTRSWRPKTARCASSTPRACGAAAGSTSPPSTTASCARCRRSTAPTPRCS